MAKRNMQPLAAGDVVLQDGNFKLKLTALELLALMPTGVTGSGIVLANVTQRFSLMTPTFDADGKPLGELPVNHSVSIRITRDAIPGADTPRNWQIGDKVIKASEAEAIGLASAESKANQDARKKAETEDRQKSVAAAVTMTRDMIRDGIELGTKVSGRGPSAVETINQIAAVLPAIKALKEAV